MLHEYLCIVYNNNNNNNNNNNKVRENLSRRKPQITHKFCIPHKKHLWEAWGAHTKSSSSGSLAVKKQITKNKQDLYRWIIIEQYSKKLILLKQRDKE